MSSGAAAVAAAFDRDAPDYDAARRRLVPCFDDFYGAALDAVAEADPGAAPRMLDLGAGTGLLSALLLRRFPDASLSLMDASDAMLEGARRRLSEVDGIAFEVADFGAAALGGPWTAIVSALAIHHLEDDAKRALFARVAVALAPGGVFVNAEQVAGPTPARDAADARKWMTEITALGSDADEIAAAGRRMAHDRCASVEDQLRWMRDAGLRDVDCTYKNGRFAVMTGRAPD